jgi:hypothetical protein
MKLENEATELARERYPFVYFKKYLFFSGIALIVEKAHLSDGKIGIEGVEVEASLQDTTKNVDENNNRKANFGLPGLIYFKTSNFLFNQKNSSSPTRKIKSELQDVMQNEFVPLECSEEVLPLNIFDLLREAIEANRTSLCCYYLVVNTLTYYFSRKTWSNSVQVGRNKLQILSLHTYFRET